MNIKAECIDEWNTDCMKWWKRRLTGKRSHWCDDWDGLPIDETCKDEIACCTCTWEEG